MCQCKIKQGSKSLTQVKLAGFTSDGCHWLWKKTKQTKFFWFFFLNCHRRSFKEPTESAPDIEKNTHSTQSVVYCLSFQRLCVLCIVLATGATAIEIFVFEMEVLPYQLTLYGSPGKVFTTISGEALQFTENTAVHKSRVSCGKLRNKRMKEEEAMPRNNWSLYTLTPFNSHIRLRI
ncbi:hypothetical protein OUZ56_027041 [Daphnia magna]|uniref:Uncharacterized protein n=1 Tax=Daphnia magna TaxID=35525 RepID=A0ABQ9ZNK0_9CRUS|nr:hypothetical protein OUZ56_027041 [Daphnia magna]